MHRRHPTRDGGTEGHSSALGIVRHYVLSARRAPCGISGLRSTMRLKWPSKRRSDAQPPVNTRVASCLFSHRWWLYAYADDITDCESTCLVASGPRTLDLARAGASALRHEARSRSDLRLGLPAATPAGTRGTRVARRVGRGDRRDSPRALRCWKPAIRRATTSPGVT